MNLSILSTIITAVFLLFILSYYVLLLIPWKHRKQERSFDGITVIVPAHNESRRIANALRCILDDGFDGKKEVIVVDDGSKDNTAEIAESFGVRVIRKKHTGKSDSINTAIERAKWEAIAIVDGDSCIEKGSLRACLDELGKQGIGAVTCAVKVRNRDLLGMWMNIEQLYNSMIRRLFCKLNMNAVTPGPLSVYRKDALAKVNNFSTDGLSEDADVAIRMVRAGYVIGFVDRAGSSTVMPTNPKGFLMQRSRLLRGMLHLLKRHLRPGRKAIDVYTMPLFVFTYVQGVVMGGITLWQISTGYYTYFVSKGVWISWSVARFFIEWFSIVGFVRWAYSVFAGAEPMTIAAILGITATLLAYPLYIYSILRFDRSFRLRHLIPIMLMAPYWLLIMVLSIICLPELFKKEQYNRWTKQV